MNEFERREVLSAAAGAGVTGAASRPAVGATGGDGEGGSAAWSLAYGDAHNTGFLPASTPAEDHDVAWTRRFEANVISKPLVIEDRCYAGLSNGDVVELDLATGERGWTASPDGSPPSSVVPTPDGVYATTADGAVYRLDPASGDTQWSHGLGDDVASSELIIADGHLTVGTRDGAVVLVDTATGDRQWRTTLSGGVRVPPSLTTETVFARDETGTLVALDRDTGDRRFTRAFDRMEFGYILGAFGGPVVREDHVYVSGNIFEGAEEDQRDGEVVALDRKTGEPVWRQRFRRGVACIVAGPERVYVDGGLRLKALDPADGHQIWETAVNSGTVAATSNTLYVWRKEDIVTYDPEDGSRVGQVVPDAGPLDSVGGAAAEFGNQLTVLPDGVLVVREGEEGETIKRLTAESWLGDLSTVGPLAAVLAGVAGYAVHRLRR